ncbi:CoA transferase subunit A [Bacillaceae bacterium Marseille-Q3522]|nr:CoA transferase subunit A [Bacillaceae bacterium Marseille-Q3522]
MEKITSASQAVALVKSNSSVMISGFLGVGAPLRLIDELAQSGVGGLTLIQSVAAFPGEVHDVGKLVENRQVKKFIGAHIGTSKHFVEQFNAGTLEVEFCPMGTLVERIRAGGSGLGAVVTPVGIGTQQEEFNEKIVIDSKEYLLYKPLDADFSLIKGFKADKIGNIVLAGTSKSSALEMALAGKTVIAEVDEIVETGDIAAEDVDIPGILVDYLVQGNTLAERRKYFQDLWGRNNMLKKEEVTQ